MSKTLHYFEVEGRGHFPLDMLRYDQCWPATQKDVAAIGVFAAGPHVVFPTERVRLASWNGDPTVERWKSFGWEVTEVV